MAAATGVVALLWLVHPASQVGPSSTVTVNSTGDSGDATPGNGVCSTGSTISGGATECTLRAAIDEANASATIDTVTFAIPTADANHVSGVWTITPTSAPLPPITAPVTIDGTTQTGSVVNNQVSANALTGNLAVQISGLATTNPANTDWDGLAVISGSSGTVIRGLAIVDFDRTASEAILIYDSSNNVIAGNYLGVKANGTTMAGNKSGVGLGGTSAGNRIGGTAAADRNVIVLAAGDGYAGVWASGVGVIATTVQGNDIGLVVGGGNAPAAGYAGVHALDGATVIVGGTANGAGNRITNTGTGVVMGASSANSRGPILGNRIWNNSAIAIDNGGGGVSANDANDTDTGPNDRLNFPIITAVRAAGTTVTVDFTLDTPAATYRIEAFTNPSGADPSGNGEAQILAGSATVIKTGTGPQSFSLTYTGAVGDIVALTDTIDLGGGTYDATSELSVDVTAVNRLVTVNSSGLSGDNSAGNGVCSTGGTNSAGATACTLKAAIQEANASATIDTIYFALPSTETGFSGGVWTISPTTANPLVALSTALTIDATTQTGYTSTPVVSLANTGLSAGPGLSITGPSVTVKGLNIRGTPGTGISVSGANATVSYCFVGTTAAGTAAAANTGAGLVVSGADTVISHNLISGNGDNGITLSAGADRAILTDNYIGTTVTGTAALGNVQEAIDMAGVANVVIGQPGHGNVLSGNGHAGIIAWNTGSTGIKVQGNKIGVGADGTTAVANNTSNTDGGIAFGSNSSGWLIGGTAAGEGNIIANNNGPGVNLSTWNATSNTIAIVGNSIYANTGLGIDLCTGSFSSGDGVTANDANDGDSGSNNLLNFPVITVATASPGTGTTVAYTFDGPAGTYRIEFFDNDSADPTGYGEAQTYLSAATITHPGGPAAYSASVPAVGFDVITASATANPSTGTYGATSELSAAVTALEPVVFDRTQKGVTTLAAGTSAVTATIATVDTSRSFLTFTLRGNDANPDNLAVTGELTNATTVTFDRAGTTGAVVLDWSVVTFTSGVTVQRGSTTFGAAATTNTVALTAVDTTRSFALVNDRNPGSSFGGNDFVEATLATTALNLTQGSSGPTVTKWQVVSYASATVKTGSVAFATTDSTKTATVASVNTAKSWLVYSDTTAPGSGTDIGQKLLRGQVTNATTLTFDRSSTGQTMTASWFLITFTDTTTVQSGSAAFTTSATTVDTTITAVDPARSIAVGGEQLRGGRSAYTADDNPGTGWFTARLTTTSNLRTQRAATGSATADVGWFIVTWPGTAQSAVAVNATGDAADLFPGDGSCDTGAANSSGAVACTLRAALAEANASSAITTVNFALPTTETGYSGGRWTISPTSALPTLSTTVVVDGTSQPGYAATPLVELNGTSAGTGSEGLTVAGSDCVIKGLAVNRFGDSGIQVGSTAAHTLIAANHLGVDPTGAVKRANGARGIDVLGLAATTTITGNLVSGNTTDGIGLTWASGATIAGNTVGLALDRNTVMANGATGIRIDFGNDIVVGATGAANVVSGNTGIGIQTAGDTVTIRYNLIGTDGTGLLDRGNGSVGVHISGPATTVGGAGAGNTIAGNDGDGIQFSVAGTVNGVVQGNNIGVGADGATAVPNGLRGIAVLGSLSVKIGGTAAGEGNVLAHNPTQGVALNAGANDVAVIGNSIFANGGLGIDLGIDGVTGNDSGDPDSGGNDLLNFPELTSADVSGGLVQGTYNVDLPAGNYRVEIYANPSGADPSGYGEAQTLVATQSIVHPSAGADAFNVTFPGTNGDVLTASVTEVTGVGTYGATSELSAARTAVLSAGPVAVDSSGRRSDASAAGGLTLIGSGPGVAGAGIDLAGAGRRLVAPATDLTSGQITVSSWLKLTSTANDPRVVAKTTAGTAVYELLVEQATANLVGRLKIGVSVVEVRGGSVSTGVWHYAALTWDGTTVRLYLDGTQLATAGASGALATDLAAPLVIGNRSTADKGLTGSVDQIQVAHTARSAAWIATTENNLANPAGYVTIGGAQTESAAPWTTSSAVSHSGGASLAAPVVGGGTGAWLTATGVDEPGVEVESWWRLSDPTLSSVAVGTRTGSVASNQYETALTASGFDLATLIGATRTQAATATGGVSPATWTKVVLRTDELGRTTMLVGGTVVRGPVTLSGGPTRGSVGFRAATLHNPWTWNVDDVQIRRLVSSEPATSLGPLDRN